jgi:hypothetical protein
VTSTVAPGTQALEIVTRPVNSLRRWQPVVGAETQDLLAHLKLPPESAKRVRDEAVEVLARCLPPTAPDAHDTGLAVGYVQSGKTMSFTTVATLARDNAFQIIIVIAGTSLPLLRQSIGRLERDLRLDTRPDRAWRMFESQSLPPSAHDSIRSDIEAWRDPSVPPAMRRTVLITVMKHHQHLDRVAKLLTGIDLRRVPALVIDDEADQASLNTNVRIPDKEESRTYARIKALRARLPHHTFVQYTATPQAPLLLSIIDFLSPSFAEVLTPGPEYVGGRDFFLTRNPLVHVIPDEELPRPGQSSDGVPDSLLRALQLFFVGVAAGVCQAGASGNRSMMVHPSQQTANHKEYLRWVREIRADWSDILDESRQMAEDRAELLEECKAAYDDLALTEPTLPPWPELAKWLRYAITHTVVLEVNARTGSTPEIDWRSNYAHILVGGQAMDRGFTVEGLTVTYMPRGAGVGNADTVQQRARFFGYKRKYLGLCRVFIAESTLDAYRRYVRHEEDMRARLLKHRATGQSLSAWKRLFILDPSLRPTRHSVLEFDYVRGVAESEWYAPDMPQHSADEGEWNREVVARLRKRLASQWREDRGAEARTEHQRHLVARGVSLRDVLEGCLMQLRYTDPADSQEFTILQIMLAEHLQEHPEATCAVYVMSKGKSRERSVADGKIKNLFQGAAPTKPADKVGTVYPGDRHLVSATEPTVQIHYVDLTEGKGGSVLAKALAVVAVHIPMQMVRDLLVQDQPPQRPCAADSAEAVEHE